MLQRLFVCALLFVVCAAAEAADPVFVDLRGAVNRSMEDDGVAANGKGGWSDEGVNDMYMFPPVTFGQIQRNGFQFNVIDPKTNGNKSVIMLKGARMAELPEAVPVKVPQAKGKYVYFLQNAVKRAAKQPKDFRVATYTVTYADKSTAEIAVRDGIEIQHWWTGQWWNNHGRESWPVFMGRNLYTMKWNMYAGVYAFQWTNPHPDKAITSITFRSNNTSVPVIWAVTVADEDFFEPEKRRKEFFKRPAGAPKGYFEPKLALERKGLFAAAVKEGLLTGLRRVELICPDLIAVTVDNALGEIAAGNGDGIIEGFQNPETFAVTSATDANYKQGKRPTRVGRQSYECWRGDIGTFPSNFLYLHTFYLRLPAPLASGHTYAVRLTRGLAKAFKDQAQIAYDEKTTPTPAIKVNQVAYAAKAKKRYAYLGYWAGDLGKVDLAAYKRFAVIDGKGQVALQGEIKVRQSDDPLSGEDVYEMDLSALPVGSYHIQVPGLGCSDAFDVGNGGARDLYYHTQRAFYHQRCGYALAKPYTTFEKPACHLKVYKSGYLVGNAGYVPKPNEEVREYRGGYHDAADFDCFTYHLRATAQALAAYEQYPNAFKDGDLNIPESGNKIPDILDEADWALFFYRDHMTPDGAVPKGRGNDQDAIRDYERKHKTRPPFGLFPPDTASNCEFAAVAAQYGRLIATYDKKRSASYIAAARKALAWADKRPDKKGGKERGKAQIPALRAWAAAELYRATGDEVFNEEFKTLYQAGAVTHAQWWMTQIMPIVQWPYAICKQPGVDQEIQKTLREIIIKRAKSVAGNTNASAYRMGAGKKDRGLGWGNANGGGHYGDPCLRAFWLTGEQAFLDAASLNADFQLGANPLSKSMITGMGTRVPTQPQISHFLYTGPKKTGQTVKGISIYGLSTRVPDGWYPKPPPPWRRWRDISGGAEVSSEFTITETIGAAAMLYSTLYALEQQ